ncbi:substrate-specific activator of APC-dependent proteolysis, partial [Dimargaris xerosporica]
MSAGQPHLTNSAACLPPNCDDELLAPGALGVDTTLAPWPSPATTPRKRLWHQAHGDRFIPFRSGRNLLAEFSLAAESPTYKRLRQTLPSWDEEQRMANQRYQALLQQELIGPSRSLAAGPLPVEPLIPNPFTTSNQLSSTPSLLRFRSQPPTPTTPRTTVYNSPYHPKYTQSPLTPTGQRIARWTPASGRRTIDKMPYRILDAPGIQDDFYLQLLDWSAKDIIAVALGPELYLWSGKSEQVTKLFALAYRQLISAVAWDPMGQSLVTGAETGCLAVWDGGTRQRTMVLEGHSDRVGVISHCGPSVLLTGGRDRLINQYDTRTGPQPIQQYARHEQEVCGLACAPGSSRLGTRDHFFASGGNENHVMVWDIRQPQRPLWRWTDHTAAVRALAWNPHDRGILLSGGGTLDKTIRVWNARNGRLVKTLATDSQVCNLVWSPSASEFVSTHGYSRHHIAVWQYPHCQRLTMLTGHRARVLNCAQSPSGEDLVTAAADETLRFWRIFQCTARPQSRLSILDQLTPIRFVIGVILAVTYLTLSSFHFGWLREQEATMGGAKRSAPRVKDNLQPTSSSRAAGQAENAAVNMFRANPTLAFRQLSLASSNTGHPSDEHSAPMSSTACPEYHLDGDLGRILKSLGKRNSATRIKALHELKEFVQTKPLDSLRPLVDAWPRHYAKGNLDVDHQLRLVTNQVHAALVPRLKRQIQPALSLLMPYWLLAFNDPYKDTGECARLAFTDLFSLDKQVRALCLYLTSTLTFVTENLCHHSATTLTDPRLLDKDEQNAVFERILQGSFNMVTYLLDRLNPEQWAASRDKLDSLLFNREMWQKFEAKTAAVRRAAYAMLMQFLVKWPQVLEPCEQLIGHAFVRRALLNRDTTTHRDLWDALLLTTRHFPNTWLHVNQKKPILPRLYDAIRHAGYGSPQVIGPCLLPLVKCLPSQLFEPSLAQPATDFVTAQYEGTRAVLDRPAALAAMVEAWRECLIHFVELLAKQGEELKASTLLTTQAALLAKVCLIESPTEALVHELQQCLESLVIKQFPRNFAEMAFKQILNRFTEHVTQNLAQSTEPLQKPLDFLLTFLAQVHTAGIDASFHDPITAPLEKLGHALLDLLRRSDTATRVRTNSLVLLTCILKFPLRNGPFSLVFLAQLEQTLVPLAQALAAANSPIEPTDPLFDLLAAYTIRHWPRVSASADFLEKSESPASSRASLQSNTTLTAPGSRTFSPKAEASPLDSTLTLGRDSIERVYGQIQDTLHCRNNQSHQWALIAAYWGALARLRLPDHAAVDALHTMPAFTELMAGLTPGDFATIPRPTLEALCMAVAQWVRVDPYFNEAPHYAWALALLGWCLAQAHDPLVFDKDVPTSEDAWHGQLRLSHACVAQLLALCDSPSFVLALLTDGAAAILWPIFHLACLDDTHHSYVTEQLRDQVHLSQVILQLTKGAQRCRDLIIRTCHASDSPESVQLGALLRSNLAEHFGSLVWDSRTTLTPRTLSAGLRYLTHTLNQTEAQQQTFLHQILTNDSQWSATIHDSQWPQPGPSLEICPGSCMDTFLLAHPEIVAAEPTVTLQEPSLSSSARARLGPTPVVQDHPFRYSLWVRLALITSHLASDFGTEFLFFEPVTGPELSACAPSLDSTSVFYRLLPGRSWLVHVWVLGWLIAHDEELGADAASERYFPAPASPDQAWSRHLRKGIDEFLFKLLHQCLVEPAGAATYLQSVTTMDPATMFAFLHRPDSHTGAQQLTPDNEVSVIAGSMVQAFVASHSTYHLRALTALWQWIVATAQAPSILTLAALSTGSLPRANRRSTPPTSVHAWFGHLAAQYTQRVYPYVYLSTIKGFTDLVPTMAEVTTLRRNCLEALQSLCQTVSISQTLMDATRFTNLVTGLAAVTHLFFTEARAMPFESPESLVSPWASNAIIQADIKRVYDVVTELQRQANDALDALAQQFQALSAEARSESQSTRRQLQCQAIRLHLVLDQVVRLLYPVLRHVGAISDQVLTYISYTLCKWLTSWGPVFGLTAYSNPFILDDLVLALRYHGVALTTLVLGRFEHDLHFTPARGLAFPEATTFLLRQIWEFFANDPQGGTRAQGNGALAQYMGALGHLLPKALALRCIPLPTLATCLGKLRGANSHLLIHSYFICNQSLQQQPNLAELTPVLLAALQDALPHPLAFTDQQNFTHTTIPAVDPQCLLLRAMLIYSLYLRAVQQCANDPSQAVGCLTLTHKDTLNEMTTVLCNTLGLTRYSTRAFNLALWDTSTFYLQEFDASQGLSYALLSASLLYRSLGIIPALVRQWWDGLTNRQVKSAVHRFVGRHFSVPVAEQELQRLRQHAKLKQLLAKQEALSLSVKPANTACTLRFVLDDVTIELMFHLPSAYPLQVVEVECAQQPVIDNQRWRGWVLTARGLQARNCQLADTVHHFAQNINYLFDGVEECCICYSVVCIYDSTLPKKPCLTCQQKFHSVCLAK